MFKTTAPRKVIGMTLAATSLFAGLGGCIFDFGSPPEAVLAGRWELTTPASTDFDQVFITFDDRGQPSRVEYRIGGINAVAPFVSGESNVNSSAVNVRFTFNGNALVFSGTLDASQNVIAGVLDLYATLGDVLVSINQNEATLTRQ